MPFGNSITVGVLELVICYEFVLLPPEFPVPAIALLAYYKRLFAELGPTFPALNLFFGGIIVGLLSSLLLDFFSPF